MGTQRIVKVAFIGALLVSFSFAQTYDLPIFFVDTKNKCLDKYVTEKIPATLKVLDGKTNAVADSAKGTPYDIGINIGEGYSALFPKPNYGIEIRDKKGGAKSESLLGYPPSSGWFLRGPYIDKSLLRESFAQWLFRQAGRYSPRTRHFHLYVNGVYRGVYVLTEEINRDKYRVNIDELKDTDIKDENLTGGYIWKFDTTSNISDKGFNTSDGLNVVLNAPSKQSIQKVQEEYLKKYLNDLEALFKNGKDGTGYDGYVDVASMVDYVLHEELTDNTDSYVYNFFSYKPRGGKVTLGPLWQYDLAMSNSSNFGYGNPGKSWQIENSNKTSGSPMSGGSSAKAPQWLLQAWKRADFQNKLKDRWAELRSGVWHPKTIDAYLDSMKTYLKNAADINFKRWPNLGKNSGQNDPDPEPMKYCNSGSGSSGGGFSMGMGGNNATTWDGEVEHVRKKVKERMTWMDQELGFLAPANPVVTAPVDPTIHEPDWHEKPAEEIVVTPQEHKNSPNSKGFTELKSPTQPQGIHQEGFGRLSPTNYFVVNGNHLEIYTDLGGTFALIDLNGSVLFKTRIETGVTSLKIPATAKDKRWIATLNGKMLNK